MRGFFVLLNVYAPCISKEVRSFWPTESHKIQSLNVSPWQGISRCSLGLQRQHSSRSLPCVYSCTRASTQSQTSPGASQLTSQSHQTKCSKLSQTVLRSPSRPTTKGFPTGLVELVIILRITPGCDLASNCPTTRIVVISPHPCMNCELLILCDAKPHELFQRSI